MDIRKGKTTIGTNAKVCQTAFSQMRGLMFTCKNDSSLIFTFKKQTALSLHMWFVFYPIDVIFLDEHKTIIETKEHFCPFSTYTPRHPYSHFLELPSGTIKKNALAVGQKLSWTPP
jgi:uncharacterized membrane protein (UPF0127 family)